MFEKNILEEMQKSELLAGFYIDKAGDLVSDSNVLVKFEIDEIEVFAQKTGRELVGFFFKAGKLHVLFGTKRGD